jgi:uncharacterized protein (DUF2252 family)
MAKEARDDRAMGVHPHARLAKLKKKQALKMARSAHAYVRGATVDFYRWLERSPGAARLPVGPPIWICGDCHVGNLGPLADAEGKVQVQIRDLDQTVIGNPAHDLIRLGLSLATAARSADLPGVTTARMVEEMVRGYELAMLEPKEAEGVPESDAIRAVRRRAIGRHWKHLAKERLEDVKPKIPLGKRFWALTDEERAALEAVFAAEATRTWIDTLGDDHRGCEASLVDAAYWIKGCSSLGTQRFAALLELRRGDHRDYALVDLKEAVAAAAPTAPKASMPADHAERVVAGARALSPNLGERMLATTVLGRPMVARELAPQDLKIEVDQFTTDEAVAAAKYLAYVVGHAHARQMPKAERDAWRGTLQNHRADKLDAPSWLWSSVVDLSASHESGYLEHCRKFALAEAA